MKTLVKNYRGFSVLKQKCSLKPKKEMGIQEWGQLVVLNDNNDIILIYDYHVENNKVTLMRVTTLNGCYVSTLDFVKPALELALEVIQNEWESKENKEKEIL